MGSALQNITMQTVLLKYKMKYKLFKENLGCLYDLDFCIGLKGYACFYI